MQTVLRDRAGYHSGAEAILPMTPLLGPPPPMTPEERQEFFEREVMQHLDALLERLGAGTLSHLEETAQWRIEDTRQKLAALASRQ